MTELTRQALDNAINRYLRSKSKGGPDSGTYQQAARTALNRWREWLDPTDVNALAETDAGAGVLRRYAQHLTERVGDDELAASSAQTYYNIVSGFLSYCVRDGVLPTNPALRDRAREELPTDDGDGRQQFWDPDTRDRLLHWIDERAYEAIETDGLPGWKSVTRRSSTCSHIRVFAAQKSFGRVSMTCCRAPISSG